MRLGEYSASWYLSYGLYGKGVCCVWSEMMCTAASLAVSAFVGTARDLLSWKQNLHDALFYVKFDSF